MDLVSLEILKFLGLLTLCIVLVELFVAGSLPFDRTPLHPYTTTPPLPPDLPWVWISHASDMLLLMSSEWLLAPYWLWNSWRITNSRLLLVKRDMSVADRKLFSYEVGNECQKLWRSKYIFQCWKHWTSTFEKVRLACSLAHRRHGLRTRQTMVMTAGRRDILELSSASRNPQRKLKIVWLINRKQSNQIDI